MHLALETSSMGAALPSADEHAQAVDKQTARSAFSQNWRLYIYEGLELALFMISACVCTVLLFHPGYPALRVIPSAILRRILMGIGMGLTAILIIHSPMGKSSGAHFNPAITVTYLRLRKIAIWDAAFYVLFQFAGGVFGVGVSLLALGQRLANPGVDYAVTIPGTYGTAAAFAAELFMAALLMGVVLFTSNRPRLAWYTAYSVGILIALYPALRSGLRIQHQSRTYRWLRCLCASLDCGLGLLHSTADRNDGCGGGVLTFVRS